MLGTVTIIGEVIRELWILWFAPCDIYKVIHNLDCRPGCHFGTCPFQRARIFSGENQILQRQLSITIALREEDKKTEVLITEVTFRSGCKIHFVRIHSVALRLNALLCLALAGSAGTVGPLSNSQLPSLATVKNIFFFCHDFFSKVCGLSFYLFLIRRLL